MNSLDDMREVNTRERTTSFVGSRAMDEISSGAWTPGVRAASWNDCLDER